jgi:hypothetical protein
MGLRRADAVRPPVVSRLANLVSAFPPNPVSQGRGRIVRFQEVGRTQQMTDMGAKRNGKSRPKAARQLLAA